VGAPAPAYSARAIGGDSIAFGGSTPAATLVNVWATWCTSCREEFADLERFRSEHQAAGLRVVAVSVDQGGEEKVRKFAEAQGGGFPVVHDRDARISRLYGVVGLPSTYLIGRDGRVRWALTGSFLEKRAELDSVMRAELAIK
jgi:peroxiredoxin